MFAAIEREQLAGIRYTSARLADGVTYVAMRLRRAYGLSLRQTRETIAELAQTLLRD